MMRRTNLFALFLGVVLSLGACGTAPPSSDQTAIQQAAAGSPEAQITVGGRTITAVSRTIVGLSQAGKLTIPQLEAYTGALKTANAQLHEAELSLETCRKTNPQGVATDPCRLTVGELIGIALTNIANIKRVIDAK
jgi:hypothetical protein